MTKIITYKVEDIFQEIPGDDENILMNIPPEIAEQLGWKPGDVLKINIEEDSKISIIKEENGQ